ncbi:MAG: hypothetical protein WBR26_12000 [Candidatus Acidiferrum sp.]
MISLAVWFTGLILLALLLFRAFEARFVRNYPLFYAYVAFVFVKSSYLLLVYLAKPDQYGRFYWYIQLASDAFGCAVVWEVYRGALSRFPGAARMTRNVLLFIVVIALSKAIVETRNGMTWWTHATMVELERDLRGFQAGVLIGLVAIVALYRIPLGRNLWGMMSGYGLFISTNTVTLALRALFGDAFQDTWRYLQPTSYIAVLCLWCVALWSYTPAPASQTGLNVEQDYQFLTAAAKKGLLDARTYLWKAMRP